MRNPLHRACICLGLTVAGVVLVLVATSTYPRLGEAVGTIIGILGLTTAIVSFFVAIWSLFAAVGYIRLRAGRDVIARWHISAAEWDRFRAFDAVRAAQDLSLRNDLHIRKPTPADGVEVIVGRRQLMVDGSYHSLRAAIPVLRAVNWLAAPADPECLELALDYPRGRHGGILSLTLRLPVPAQARAAGVLAFEHYRAFVPLPNEPSPAPGRGGAGEAQGRSSAAGRSTSSPSTATLSRAHNAVRLGAPRSAFAR